MVSPLRYEAFVPGEPHGLSASLRGICARRAAWSLRFATRHLCEASLMVSPLRYEAFVPGEEHPAHAQKTEARMNAAPMMSSTL